MPDYPRSLIAFRRRFGDDRAGAESLFSVRWPEGFRCPARGHPKGWALETKAWTFQCAKCAKQMEWMAPAPGIKVPKCGRR